MSFFMLLGASDQSTDFTKSLSMLRSVFNFRRDGYIFFLRPIHTHHRFLAILLWNRACIVGNMHPSRVLCVFRVLRVTGIVKALQDLCCLGTLLPTIKFYVPAYIVLKIAHCFCRAARCLASFAIYPPPFYI